VTLTHFRKTDPYNGSEEPHPLTTLEPPISPDPPIEISGATDRGLVRPSNEDSYVILQGQDVPHWCLVVTAVFDGVGGLGNGQEASAGAARYLAELLVAPTFEQVPRGGPGQVLADLMLELHAMLRRDRQREPHLKKMATTATIALVARAQPKILWIGHVGDSPALRLRAGSIEKLVAEDSLVAGMVRDGLITPEKAQRHPQRHVITQALGHSEEINPHVNSHEVKLGNRYLLCTDGLTTMLPEARILEIAAAAVPQTACQDLIAAANNAGGIDNITVILMGF